MSDDLADLSIDQLFALFGALVDPEQGVPAGVEDPAVRRALRARNAGTYVFDEAECRSRSVDVTELLPDGDPSALLAPIAPGVAPAVELPAETEDFILLELAVE